MLKKDAKGRVIYDSKKGDFVVGENVTPEYSWFNGEVTYTLLGDKVDKSDGITLINTLGGSASDGRSLIWPMKVMRGTQPYDPVNKTLVMPHTAGNDDTAYWKNFNWEKAIATGMKDATHPSRARLTSSRPICPGRSPIWSRPRKRLSAATSATPGAADWTRSRASTFPVATPINWST